MRAKTLIAAVLTAILAVFTSGSLSFSPASAQSGAGYLDFVARCNAIGTHYPGPGYGTCVPRAGPPQPSPEELRRQREAQDLQEAADDALDRGVAAYRRGDYSTAALKFEESLQYNPDDPVAQQNLDQARQRLQEAFVQESARAAAAEQAQRQRLNSLSGSATREGVAAHAGQADPIFDGRRGARDMGGIAVGSGAAVVGASVRDPVVPQARMTPAIASFERQRTEQRARITAIDAEVRTLNPTMHATRIERRRQERAQAESQVTFINFSINEALSAPPPSQGAGN